MNQECVPGVVKVVRAFRLAPLGYRLNNCFAWHRQKLHNGFNLFICLLWLVFLFKMALIKMR